MPAARINDLVRTAIDYTVIFDFSDLPNATAVILPRAALQRFANEGLDMQFISYHGTINFSASEIAELIQEIRTDNVTLALEFAEPIYDQVAILPPDDDSPFNILRFSIGSSLYTDNGTLRVIEAAPFIEGDRTMIPIRFIAEAMGAEVIWVGETRMVFINKGGIRLQLTIDTPLPDDMGTPVIVGSRTFVPMRYVSEMLGADVRWDNTARAVYIYLP